LAVCGLLALDCVFNGEDVFASVAGEFVIPASATRLFIVQSNGVLLLPPLCDGTSQRLLLPLRVSFVFAAISKPLISLGSIVIISTH
jgi:hypothetical protein